MFFFNLRRKFKLDRVTFCDLVVTPWVLRNVMDLSRTKPLYILVIRYIQSGLDEIPEKTPNKKRFNTNYLNTIQVERIAIALQKSIIP